MKSKTTTLWFMLATALFAGIWICQKYLPPAAPGIAGLLPGLHAGDVTGIQVSPAGAPEIEVVRTNHLWRLQKPLAYPAQATAVEALAAALEKLTPQRLTAADLRGHNADAEYGFDNPQFRLDLAAGEQSWHLLIGNKTAPGDQVFIRVVGLEGAFVSDAGWLQLLPRSADDWRDTALVDAAGVTDWIVITNSAKALTLEFRRDPTNQLWRMIQPRQTRADSARLAAALQQLQTGRVTQFVTDDPHADLGSYGLQPADLDVWLGHGTNFTSAVHAGKTPADNPALLFARREGWNSVVTAAKETLAPWRGAVNDYRDPHLLALTAPVAEIEVRGENSFTLQSRGSNNWTVAGEKFPADREKVQEFIQQLAGLRVAEFVKDVVTAPDLQGFGLTTNSRQIILRGTAGDTNSVLAQLIFGTVETNRVFVKRGDEDFVYALTLEDYARLPEAGWEFRDRHLWNFSVTNVVQLTLRQNGKTRQLLRTGRNQWSLAPGSQGMIDPKSIEQTVEQLAGLTVKFWVTNHLDAPDKYGFYPDNLQVTVELKTGEKLSVDFGLELPKAQTALAAMTLDGERWAFVFPVIPYQMTAANLTIP